MVKANTNNTRSIAPMHDLSKSVIRHGVVRLEDEYPVVTSLLYVPTVLRPLHGVKVSFEASRGAGEASCPLISWENKLVECVRNAHIIGFHEQSRTMPGFDVLWGNCW